MSKVDFTKFIDRVKFRNLNICGPFGVGKTSYLKAIRQYNDEYDPKSTASNCCDRHFVISLDFSDYSGKTYEEAICYFRKKMSELYVFLYENVKGELEHYKALEWFLDVEEGICDVEKLRNSLVDIVRLLRYGKHYQQNYYRPLIIIDEISRPILYASKYGYYRELSGFYDDFLNIDHYEMTAGIITTSFAPVNTDVHYGMKYISDVPVNLVEPFNEICDMQGIELSECRGLMHFGNVNYFDTAICLEKCFEEMMINSGFAEITDYNYDIELSDNVENEIESKRIWIDVQKYNEEEANERKKERERREYAEPLMWGTYLPSKYAGIRNWYGPANCSQQRIMLNERLKELYEKYGKSADTEMIYNDIQHVGKLYDEVCEIKKMVVGLKKYADDSDNVKNCQVDIYDEYWAKVDVEKEASNSGGDMSLLKAYISVKETKNILKVFDRAIRFLVDEGKDLFHAKVSIRERNDHICLWISNADFYKLEKYMSGFDELLHTPLEFVPYRRKIGITREFFSWSSYNELISELIALYFQSINSGNDIDVIDMYSKYVKAWNGDCEESDSFSERFKASNAQEFIILLESLNIIIDNEVIHNDNILFNNNGKMWCALGESKNWHEVGVRMKKI